MSQSRGRRLGGRRVHLRMVFLWAGGLGLLLACSSGVERCEPVVSACAADLDGAQEPSALGSMESTPFQRGRVYLDLSASMRGFVSDDTVEIPFTLFQKALDQVVPEAFGAVRSPPVEVIGFGAEISQDIDPLQAYAVQSPGGMSPRLRYDEMATDLVRVIADVAGAPESLSVVITDGIQDRRTAGGSGSAGPGFVRTALVEEMRRSLVEQGFGIWLVGVMSRFSGCYFNVKPNAEKRVNQCIPLEGHRPVFFWIFTKDLKAGRLLTAYLVEQLQRETASTGSGAGETANGVELWPGRIPRLAVAVDARDSSETFRDNLIRRIIGWQDRLANAPVAFCCPVFRGGPGGRLRLPLALRLDAGGSGPGPIQSAPAEIWSLVPPLREEWPVKVQGGWQAATGASPWLPLSLEIPYEEAARRVALDEPLEIPFRLQLRVRQGLRGHWLERWSTADDSTAETVEGKALYLEDIAVGLLEATLGDAQPGICLQMRLRRG